MKKNKLFNKVKELIRENKGISIRKLSNRGIDIFILYIQQLTDRERLSIEIIKPILDYGKKDILDIDKMVSSIIYIDDISIDNDINKISDYILKGKSVIIISNDERYIVADTTKVGKREIKSPEIESTLRGAKDSFNENLDDNLSLIRYRIKDPELKVDNYSIGRRSKTNVAVIYIKDIANEKYVDEIKNKLESIDIDGIFESGYIQKFLLNNAYNLFPQTGIIERSDTACAHLIEGKICILVEGSNLALVVPKVFIEFIDAGDDHYDNIYLSIFSKFIRVLCFMIALTLSAAYVAVVSFHPDILPPQYILTLASSRATVPFNALLEAGIMEMVAEILREASIRLPQQIGPAIGIVGTIVIGQAAVAAGLVSPLMVIIVALSIMSSFAAGDFTIIKPIRILKFMMLFFTGVLGIFGFVMGLIIITINMCSINTLGTSYVAPLSPFNLRDLVNYFLGDITITKKRPKLLKTRDKTRQ